ncbi:hypothetical protein Daus18300_010296 [Diaporthe australafricana]|uniref:Uncharacterized protein n=1 Tax=Diaporthe australafricana TaxID=127596 RepID=A0ABR3WAR0_9PEZI
MANRRIRYGTPGEFRAVTHAQLEHFDNKPPPQPLEEPEPTDKPAKATESEAKPNKSTETQSKPEAEKMRQSEGDNSTTPEEITATQTVAKEDEFIPDRRGGWDGKVTKYDASTMYLG